MLKDFVTQHPGVSERLAAVFGKDMAIEREASQGTSSWTGITSLDAALKGLPWGLVEVVGPESVGKTGFIYQVAAQAQREERPVVLLATEVLDVPYMRRAGVDPSKLPVLLGQEALPDLLDFTKNHEGAVILIDSFTALRPPRDGKGDWNAMAYDTLRAIHGTMKKESCAVITSQVRAKLGDRQGTHSASRRVEDLFQTRLELSRQEVTDSSYELVVNIVAHQVSTPATYVSVPASKGAGADLALDLVRTAEAAGIFVKNGNWIYYNDERIGRGERVAALYLEKHEDFAAKIRGMILDL